MTFAVKRTVLAAVAALSMAASAQAAIFTFTGDTTGKPVFNRPLEDLSGLSAVGLAVRYDVFSFKVSVSGAYSFLTTGAFDTFSILYSPSFIASSGLTNARIANDDAVGPTTSSFQLGLTAGTSYALVTTGFAATDFGAYSVTIGGPGAVVSAVPEPATVVFMALGLGAIGLFRRRRAAAND